MKKMWSKGPIIRILLGAFTLLILFILACGDSATDTPTPTSAPAATATATPRPTPTPTPTLAPMPVVSRLLVAP